MGGRWGVAGGIHIYHPDGPVSAPRTELHGRRWMLICRQTRSAWDRQWVRNCAGIELSRGEVERASAARRAEEYMHHPGGTKVPSDGTIVQSYLRFGQAHHRAGRARGRLDRRHHARTAKRAPARARRAGRGINPAALTQIAANPPFRGTARAMESFSVFFHLARGRGRARQLGIDIK